MRICGARCVCVCVCVLSSPLASVCPGFCMCLSCILQSWYNKKRWEYKSISRAPRVLFLWNQIAPVLENRVHNILSQTSKINCSSGHNRLAFVSQQHMVTKKKKKTKAAFQRKRIVSILHPEVCNVGFCLTRYVFSPPVKAAAKLWGWTVSSILQHKPGRLANEQVGLSYVCEGVC